MKKFCVAALALAFIFSMASINLYAAELSWDEAKKHIGEEATVCGKIIDSSAYGTLTILGMGKGVRAVGAVGVEVTAKVKKQIPKSMYKGKVICVTGKIHRNPAGGASIKVANASQIVVK